MIIKLKKYHEENSRIKTSKRNRFWSALFPENLPSSSESRKRRVFPDPACKIYIISTYALTSNALCRYFTFNHFKGKR